MYRNKLLWMWWILFLQAYCSPKGDSQREQSLRFKSSNAISIFRILSNWARNIFIQILLRFQVASSYAEPFFTLFQNFHSFYSWNMGLPYLKTHVPACMHTHSMRQKAYRKEMLQKSSRISEEISFISWCGTSCTLYLTSLFFHKNDLRNKDMLWSSMLKHILIDFLNLEWFCFKPLADLFVYTLKYWKSNDFWAVGTFQLEIPSCFI